MKIIGLTEIIALLNGKFEIFECTDIDQDLSKSKKVSIIRELEIKSHTDIYIVARIEVDPKKDFNKIYVFHQDLLKEKN